MGSGIMIGRAEMKACLQLINDWVLRCRIAEIKTVFNQFDVNHDGVVSLDEAKAAMKGLDFSESEIEMLVDNYDVNRDGKLQYEEFIQFWMGKKH